MNEGINQNDGLKWDKPDICFLQGEPRFSMRIEKDFKKERLDSTCDARCLLCLEKIAM